MALAGLDDDKERDKLFKNAGAAYYLRSLYVDLSGTRYFPGLVLIETAHNVDIINVDYINSRKRFHL